MYRVPQFTESERADLNVNIVSRNYFDMLGVAIVSGHGFNDDRDGPCRMAIVNEEAADRFFGGDAVGGALIDVNGLRTTVVGVIASPKLRAAQRESVPEVFFPYGQDFVPRMTMLLENDRVSGRRLRELHRRLEQVPGGRPERIIVTTLDRHLSQTAYAPERIATVLIGSSAAIALALGALGVYGVMNDAARRRRRELALRIALGAQNGRIIRQVVAEGLRLVIVGTIIGAAGSLMVARWIATIAPVADAPSAMAWLAAPLSLLAVLTVASVLPARKATATDPLLIMRSD
jgi:ABC-type antimicrobial peptide transport system permease subunit